MLAVAEGRSELELQAQHHLLVRSSDVDHDTNYTMTTTTTASLNARLSALTDARKTTQTLITRLSRLPGHPGSDNSEIRAELSSEIHQLLKEQEEELDLVRQDVEDFVVGRDREKEAERARLDISVQRLGEDLKLCVGV